jgi:dephospho-CoA kinase
MQTKKENDKPVQHHLIALSGMCGSGKSVVADELVKQGWQFLRFGQITLDLVKERGLQPTEANERGIRESIRKEHGMGAYALLNMPKLEALLKKGNVVVDNLMSWSEYKILKEKFGKQFIQIAVFSPPERRYDRLEKRHLAKEDTDLRHRPFSKEESKSRDYAEIEKLEKGGPIAMADYILNNRGTVPDLIDQLHSILKEIEQHGNS